MPPQGHTQPTGGRRRRRINRHIGKNIAILFSLGFTYGMKWLKQWETIPSVLVECGASNN